MSRSLVYGEGGKVIGERVIDVNKCRWLVDDVCCNADSPQVGDFPFDGFCEKHCRFFEKENKDEYKNTVYTRES